MSNYRPFIGTGWAKAGSIKVFSHSLGEMIPESSSIVTSKAEDVTIGEISQFVNLVYDFSALRWYKWIR